MNREPKQNKTNDQKSRPLSTPSQPIDPRLAQYPSNRREYERMMRHDSFRKVRGAFRQTRWGDHDQ